MSILVDKPAFGNSFTSRSETASNLRPCITFTAGWQGARISAPITGSSPQTFPDSRSVARLDPAQTRSTIPTGPLRRGPLRRRCSTDLADCGHADTLPARYAECGAARASRGRRLPAVPARCHRSSAGRASGWRRASCLSGRDGAPLWCPARNGGPRV